MGEVQEAAEQGKDTVTRVVGKGKQTSQAQTPPFHPGMRVAAPRQGRRGRSAPPALQGLAALPCAATCTTAPSKQGAYGVRTEEHTG